MPRIGIGTAMHILDALTTAGVDRDQCYEHEDGSVNVHLGDDIARVRVVHVRGYEYGATADDYTQLNVQATLPTVARRVAEYVKGWSA